MSFLDLIPVVACFDPREHARKIMRDLCGDDETATLTVVGRWVPKWVQPEDGGPEHEDPEAEPERYEEIWRVETCIGPARSHLGVDIVVVAY